MIETKQHATRGKHAFGYLQEADRVDCGIGSAHYLLGLRELALEAFHVAFGDLEHVAEDHRQAQRELLHGSARARRKQQRDDDDNNEEEEEEEEEEKEEEEEEEEEGEKEEEEEEEEEEEDYDDGADVDADADYDDEGR